MFKKIGAYKLVVAHWTMELFIVVAGVLIALSAQQWAEDRSSKRRADAAERAMALEIQNSLLANEELVRLSRCTNVQLAALQNAIVNGDRLKAGLIVKGGTIFGSNRLWADNAFQAALTADLTNDLGAEKLKRYSQVYDMIRKARALQDEREQTRARIGTLAIVGLPASPEINYSLLTATTQLRSATTTMEALGGLIAMFAKKDLGLKLARGQFAQATGRIESVRACEQQAHLAGQPTSNPAG